MAILLLLLMLAKIHTLSALSICEILLMNPCGLGHVVPIFIPVVVYTCLCARNPENAMLATLLLFLVPML